MVMYEWRFYDVDYQDNYEILTEMESLKEYSKGEDNDYYPLFGQYGDAIELHRMSDGYDNEWVEIRKLITGVYVFAKTTFNCGTKIPQQFYKELAEVQGIAWKRPAPKPKTYSTPKSPEFVDYVKSTALNCAEYLRINGMVKKPKTFVDKLDIRVKRIQRSWGGLTRDGSPRITISAEYELASGKFNEYPRICKVKGIGEFHSANAIDHIHAVVAHEVAHAADYWNGDRSSHGNQWRVLYRALRKHLNVPEA